MWDSWPRDKHWNQKEWRLRETLEVGMPIIVNDPVISWEKIIFPPLDIKLGLMKPFVRALNTDAECFQHIVSVHIVLSFKRIKADVLDGTQIHALVHDEDYQKDK